MLGASAVGKTSLVSRFVTSIFPDKYLTTVGVKIDKKIVTVGEQEISLILWDLAGEDEFMQVRTSYLRGSSGYLLVVDGTRRPTLEKAIELHERAERELGKTPVILVINKSDLVSEWEIEDGDIDRLTAARLPVMRTSAKTGAGVDEAFLALGQKAIE